MNERTPMTEWVRELRAKTGMSQRQLGERCGLTTQYVTLIETGRRCPSKPVLILMQQMSDLLNMPPPPDCKAPPQKARAEVTDHEAI